MAGYAKRSSLGFGVCVVVAASALPLFWPGQRTEAAFGDGSVRVISNGPITLMTGDTASSMLLLPAVQRAAARVTIVGGDGKVLFRKNYEAPTTASAKASSFFDVFFDIAITDTEIVFDDGAGREIIGEPVGNMAMLGIIIQLKLPAVQDIRMPEFRSVLATLQVDPSDPSAPMLLLPYIEQNVFAGP
ncbi:MAG: hypothetical protein HUU46_16570 [Candidatus Hydrogenedentes bacterium]|nr:hypothetical protein [Candidatus Hydrogenedentota bacterium]